MSRPPFRDSRPSDERVESLPPASSFSALGLFPFFPVLAQGEESGGAGIFSFLVPIGLMYFVIYILILRPQRKQQAQHQLMLNDLKKGDEVQVTGGFIGEVVSVDTERERVEVRVDARNNTRLTVVRSSIVAILNRDGPAEPEPAK